MNVAKFFTQVWKRADARWSRFFLAAVVVALFLVALPAARASEPIDYGYRDFSYPSGTGGNSEPTGEKPESKLWWNDGIWWGSLWSTAGNAYHIFRLDQATQSWVDTGTAIDDRADSRADALWDGQHLYVVSHIFAKNAGAPAPSGQRGELYRYSYDTATKTYSLDSGFPVEVTGGESETLVVEKDANGKLWVTYVENQKVMVNRSLNGDDRQWGTPFQIPGSESNVSSDDISSIITYNQHVGVMWSNQNSPKEMYFAVHPVGASDTTWTPVRAYGVSGDDHLSLKSLEADSAGNVYAAIKTSRSAELIVLLVCENNINRCKQESDWSSYPVYDGTHSPTRPILLIDTGNRDLYVFTRNKDASGDSGIYYKTADLDSIQFPVASIGTPFIKNSTDTGLNDPTSTKQNLTSATGMVVVASDGDYYFHNYKSLPSGATQYSLTVDTVGSGTVTMDPPGGLYDEGASVTLTATPAPGWTFAGWSGDYSGTENPATINMDANKTITATFTGSDPTQYTLTVDVVGTGSVALDPAGGVYDPDTTVTLTALPGSGWTFSGWSGDLAGTANPATITMDADKAVAATFSESGGTGEVIYRETQAGSSAASTGVSTSLPLTAANGDLYLAAISAKPNEVVQSVSGLGLSWTEVRAQCAGRDATGVAIWMAQGTPSGDGVVSATLANVPRNAVIAVTRYSGVASGTPIGAIVSGNTNGVEGACSGGTDSDAYSFDLTTTGSGSVVYGAAAIRNRTHQPGTGFLERIEVAEGSGGDVATVVVQDKTVASPSTTTVDGTISSTTDWAVVGLELKPELVSGPAQYTVITTTVGSGSITLDPPGGTYDEGSTVTVTATADTGWAFSGWSGDLSGTGNPATLTMDADKSVAATFTEQYTLTVNTTGTGSGNVALDPPGGMYDAGTVVTLTATADAGSAFTGWSGDVTGTTNPVTVTMDVDKTVTADFAAQRTLTVTTLGSGSVALEPPGGVYDEGTVVTLTATADTGWAFSGWSGDLTGTTNPATVTMDADKTVTATFVEEPPPQYTLTVNTTGTGSGNMALDPPGGTYDAGTVVTLTATAEAGSAFTGWSGDVTGTTNPVTVTMDADKMVTADFAAQRTLTVTTAGSGSVALEPPGGVYDEGTVVTLTATADVGWSFSGWSGDLSGTTNPETLVMDADKAVTATFVEEPPPQYTLTVTTVGSGSVTLDPTGGVYDEGTTVTLTATADAGWSFSGWSGDLTGTTNPATLTMDADKTVTATFVEEPPPQYTLTVTTAGSGNVTLEPAGGVYDEGTVVTLTATPDTGWTFSGWSGDLTGTTNPATVTMDADKTVTATFVEEPPPQYTLTVNTVGSGNVTPEPAGGVYDEGTVVTVTATADTGWVFSGWSGDLTGTANPATVTMDADKTVTATFVEEPPPQYTLTVNTAGSGSVALDPAGGVYDEGTVVTLTATADFGWSFSGWSGDLSGTTNPETLVMDADKTVTATFVEEPPPQYTLTVNTVGSGNVTLEPAGGVYGEGTVVTVTATADTGWTFSGWSGDLTGTTNPATVTMDADKTVTATFVEEPPPQYTLTVNTVGSGNVTLEPAGGVYDEGTVVTLTATPDTGWTFSGWSGDLSGTANPATLTMDADKAVTATFLQQTRGGEVSHEQTVTGSSGGTSSVSTDGPITGVAGDLYLAAVSTKTNVGVQGVTGLGLSWTPVRVQCAGRDATGVAVWMALGTPSGDGIVTATLDNSPNNAVIAVSRYTGVDSAAPLGNVVSGNTNGVDGACSGGSDSDAYAFDLTTTVSGSIVYGAVAMRNRSHEPGPGYTELVEVSQGNGGAMAGLAVQEKAVSSPATTSVAGTTSSKTDWAVIGLEIRPGAGDGTIQHVLTTDASGSGSITLEPAGGVYDEGTVVTLTAAADPGWAFSGWSGDLSGTANPATITMDADKAVTANFTASDPGQRALTVNTVGSGSVALDPAGGVYDEGTVVTLTATPDAGWTFSGWSGDLSGTANPATLTMDADKTVTATFTADAPTQYALTVTTVGSGNVTLEPAGGSYPAGTEVTLTAMADSGWVFSGWSGDLSGTTNPATLTMDADKAVTATFLQQTSGDEVRHEQTVTGSSGGTSSVSTDGPITGVAGDLYLAAVSTKTNVGVQGVTGLGLSWTPVRVQCAGRDATGVAVWMALGTPSGDGIVTATLDNSPTNAVIAVSRYTGVDSAAPLGNVVSGNTNGVDGACSGGSDSDAYAFDLTTTVSGSIVYGAVAMRNRSHEPGPGYTELVEVSEGSGGAVAAVAVQEKAVASPSVTSVAGTTSSSTDWAVIGLEIRPGAGTLQNVLSAEEAGSGDMTTKQVEGIRDGDLAIAPKVASKPDWSLSG